MKTFFFTGYPGFLGTELIRTLLPAMPDVTAACLVQKKFMPQAQQSVQKLCQEKPTLAGRIQLIEGDITLPDLGITSELDALQENIDQIFHLAAVYDLAVSLEIGTKVNVDGTRNTLEFAKKCKQLSVFQYVSTCYVSGRHPGRFCETDLDLKQEFNNFYEQTKFEAEKLVQNEMKQGLPGIIYRPAVVVGDSTTGATAKFDGPYYFIQWLLRQSRYALIPMIGNPKAHTINIVPSDYVVRAMAYLSQRPELIGKTFHLSDPHPLTVHDMIHELGRASGKKIVSLPISLGIAQFSLSHIQLLQKFLRIPPATLNYFVHPTEYSSDFTQKILNEGQIKIPPFQNYSAALVHFMKQHPEIRNQAMN